jgi:hypothetical protein
MEGHSRFDPLIGFDLERLWRCWSDFDRQGVVGQLSGEKERLGGSVAGVPVFSWLEPAGPLAYNGQKVRSE